jgi:predicted DNA-binding transcriptional regulator YafY
MDAHCRTQWGTIRMYRLNRIRYAEILPQTSFEIREDYSFKQRHQHAFSVYTGDTPITVKIRFNAEKAAYIQEVCWHPSQKITSDPEHPGSIIFEVQAAYPKEVIWWMRRWCQDAEVLEPCEMREYMLEIAQQEVAMYGDEERKPESGTNLCPESPQAVD